MNKEYRSTGQEAVLLDGFLDSYRDWTVNGKGLKYASRELRYCLNQRKKRLENRGIETEESFEHVKEEIRGCLKKDDDSYLAKIIYRETNHLLSYKKNGRTIKNYKMPVTIYGTLLDKEGYEDVECTCPNCGHVSLTSQLSEGCPYCGTVFETDESYPCFTSFFTVPGIVERSTLMDKIKKRMIIVGSIAAVLGFLLVMFGESDYVIWFKILEGLFFAGFFAFFGAFFTYMAHSIVLLFRIFFEAGRALPLMKGIRTKNRLEKKMQKYDPDFSFEYFEGRVISLFRTIAYSKDRDKLCIYTSDRELPFLDDLIDIQYRGALQLLHLNEINGRIHIDVKAFMTVVCDDSRFSRKDVNYILSLEKDINNKTKLGFTPIRIQCPNCSGSFDAMHLKKCPHCGSDYDLVHDDWVITGIRE
ncbi:MAG: hypothetical protein J5365_01260 [Erysipelotrichaceae bacterium]|nr:hypothetical protein [Erysipelotrichaceae bacterium]